MRPMRHVFWFMLALVTPATGQNLEETFRGKLHEGWKWVREDTNAWRLTERGLFIRVQPGNMWGGQNNARNLLVRPAPAPSEVKVEATLLLENRPTHQYEQVNLVWYYDDSNMVKLGQELVDGKLSIVMGREEKDRTRTIAIIPLSAFRVEVRIRAEGNRLVGDFRPNGTGEWLPAGECDLPQPENGRPHISIHCYQGPNDAEHWAHLERFTLTAFPKP